MPVCRRALALDSSASILHYLRQKNRMKRQPVNEIYKLRDTLGEFHHLYPKLREDEELFRSYARMSTSTFDYIVSNIRSEFMYSATNFQRPISVDERLMLTLRYLATGISFRQLAFTFRISKSTVSRIVKEVSIAIWKTLVKTHMPVPGVQEFEKIADDFYNRWGFPHALGCIDGKHIEVKCPPKSGSMFFCYKQYFSIVLMALTDANYKFIMVDVGSYGKDSDGAVFARTPFYDRIESGTLPLPTEKPLPNSIITAPYVFLGDEAFPLRKYLMRPFPWKQATNDTIKRKFNYQLSRARMTVECSFGIIAAKFRLLRKAIETDVETAKHIVKAITLLHNVIIDMEGPLQFQQAANTDSATLSNIRATRNNNRATDSALNIRKNFCQFFVNQARI